MTTKTSVGYAIVAHARETGERARSRLRRRRARSRSAGSPRRRSCCGRCAPVVFVELGIRGWDAEPELGKPVRRRQRIQPDHERRRHEREHERRPEERIAVRREQPHRRDESEQHRQVDVRVQPLERRRDRLGRRDDPRLDVERQRSLEPEDVVRMRERRRDVALDGNPDRMPRDEDETRRGGARSRARRFVRGTRSRAASPWRNTLIRRISHQDPTPAPDTLHLMADLDGKPLDERLQEIGTQLAWVRDYL